MILFILGIKFIFMQRNISIKYKITIIIKIKVYLRDQFMYYPFLLTLIYFI